jgi:hypothetical protein
MITRECTAERALAYHFQQIFMKKLHLFSSTCFIVLVACLTLAAEVLPERLSDKDFWKLVVESSELTQQFPGDNFVSNETKYLSVARALQQNVSQGGAYIGVGPEQNFTYIAIARPKLAFIVDIRRQNMIEHLMYKALFEMSESRADYLSRLFSRKRPEGLAAGATVKVLMDAYAATAPQPELASIRRNLSDHGFELNAEDSQSLEKVFNAFAALGTEVSYNAGAYQNLRLPTDLRYSSMMSSAEADGKIWSYLASEESYGFVRDLQRRNLIVPLVGDFAGPKAIRSVGAFLRKYEAPVRVFYLSNVETYLFAGSGPGAPTAATRATAPNGGWRAFFDNVSALPLDSASTFIRFQGGGYEGRLGSMQKNLEDVKNGTIQTVLDIYK